MAKMNAELILNFRDNVSKGLQKVTNNLNKVKQATSGVTRAAKAMGTGLKAAAAGVGLIGGAAAGIFKATEAAIKFADAIAKSADVAGLSTTTLQELRFAMGQFGVEQRLVDEGMRRFNRRLGEFRKSGGGPAKTALEQLGLATRVMKGDLTQTEPALREITKLMGQMEDQSQVSALAAQLFGDDAGPKLALALRNGIDAIDELSQQAHDLGLVLDESIIREAEKAGDELTILYKIIKTQVVAAFLQLVPQVRAFAQYLINNRGVLQEWVQQFAQMAIDIVKVAGAIAKATINLAKFLGIVDRSLDEQIVRASNRYLELKRQVDATTGRGPNAALSQQLRDAKREYKELLDQKIAIEKARKDAMSEDELLGRPTTPASPTGSDTPFVLGRTSAEIKAAAREQERVEKEADRAFEEAVRKSEEAVKRDNAEYQKWLKTRRDAADAIQDTIDPMRSLNEELERATELNKQGFLSDEDLEKFAANVRQRMTEVENQMAGTTDTIKAFWDEAARSMQTTMSDTFFGWMQGEMTDLGNTFKRVIDRMVADFLAAQFNQMIVKQFGGIGGIFGSIFGGIKPLFGARAEGGPVVGGQPYIVGEKGPEMFVPSSSGDIIPNHQMGGANVTFNINAMDGADVKRTLEKERRFITEMVIGTGSTYRMETA